MSILVNKNTKVITQGITGKTGQFHTRMCRDYANGKNCFVAGVNPKKAGEDFEGIPIFDTVKEAKAATGATVTVIYVPPPFAAAAIDEAVDAGLDLVVCITEGIPVRDMIDIVDGRQLVEVNPRIKGKVFRRPVLVIRAEIYMEALSSVVFPDGIELPEFPGHFAASR